MDEIRDKLSLAIRIALLALDPKESEIRIWKIQNWESKDGNNQVETTLLAGTDLFVSVIGLNINDGKQCILSLFLGEAKDNKSLGQGVLDYKDDLKLDQEKFPVSIINYLHNKRHSDIIDIVRKKLQLKENHSLPKLEEHEYMKRALTPGVTDPKISISKDQQGLPRTTNSSGNPPDMPDFDDEYEMLGGKNPSQQNPYPGLNIAQPQASGYGQKDLYPTGERIPNLLDPLATSRPSNNGIMGPGSGGMSFDPLRDFQRQQDDANSQGNVGRMPGARWSDPFGKGNPGGGAFGSSGFGSGGFRPGEFGPGGFI
ncbi:hypothetical protein TBLA_0I02460 [Henningerozyma blattae CBS 6284]|uniref:PI31 proteasome regulator C-terminal domain-containing protein n=1 Tax=Henningerozyma blattae (strain ATCC 34711 / CBS 6284 / DSM 70876 / NBRC 10599 / NRRL Y-10934 / UCD 77-7) TaxID=1071380 RepID=I2H952_HENB6|nr:hypothetical protein TBLA_0I02460 [Tetrapisispora blattae CBS 6284]CCH62904.1 hypothetical protein TBLA_0I02460 [Tetrapisispora blattae CBS 6284]